jgi:hypothetical protein
MLTMSAAASEYTDGPTESTEVEAQVSLETAEMESSSSTEDAPEPTATPPQTDTSSTHEEITTAAATPVQMQIDDKNVYKGMDRAYKDGYVPQVTDGVVSLVMPLLISGDVQGNEITVTPNLGDTYSSPIQYRNYQKSFSLEDNQVNVSDMEGETVQTVSSYLVQFDLPLNSNRTNGVYPITLEVQARNASGATVQQSFTCYVTITDGKSTDTITDTATDTVSLHSGGETAETPESKPRILVSSYSVDAVPVQAGEDFTVTVTLCNTSEDQDVQNMLVTVSTDSANFVLKNDTNTIFLGDLTAGATKDLELTYRTDLETPPQRYTINLNMEYDDSNAMTMSSSGSMMVEVAQAVEVELSPFYMDSEVNAGETVQLSFQVMNLGRGPVYNVRVELDVPGLSPTGTAFIGNMESGTSAEATMNVFVGMKEGDERYGYTSGTVRLIYEDVSGQKYVDETIVSTNIKELVISSADNKEEDEPERAIQWWAAVGLGVVVIVALIFFGGKKKRISHRHVKL